MVKVLNKIRILVVDDSPDTLEVLQRTLRSAGYQLYTAPGALEAIEFLESTPVDLVITDSKMPGISGIDLVRHVKENYRDTEIMMITGYASIEGAIQAVKTGAQEYLAKPFTDHELFAAVQRSISKLLIRKTGSSDSAGFPFGMHGIIGQSESMQLVLRDITKSSGNFATVLITGESGTGKELVARAIHYGGLRASAPFVPVNCGAIPEELLESELFGYLKGAFTGANESRAGFFQTAEGGTIFLDEISEMTLSMQVRLLRVIQDKEVRMVGSSKTRKVDVRILAATNKELPILVRKGIFREDLYFRLNVLTIQVPPLREHPEDIPILVDHFLDKFAAETGKPPPKFSEDAMQTLLRHNWPGNVRELENLVHRLVLMCESDVIEIPDLPELMRFAIPKQINLNRTLAQMEQEYIASVLRSVKNNKTLAAQILGIDRKTLRVKMKLSNPEGSGE